MKNPMGVTSTTLERPEFAHEQIRSVEELEPGMLLDVVHNQRAIHQNGHPFAERVGIIGFGKRGYGLVEAADEADWLLIAKQSENQVRPGILDLADVSVIPYDTGRWNNTNYILPSKGRFWVSILGYRDPVRIKNAR